MFEDLVVSKMKVKVLEKATKYQIGGMKGHRSTEHLFSIKSVCGKAYRLWYNLNKNTKITIQTGVGLTDACNTG